jgi:MFS family permease
MQLAAFLRQWLAYPYRLEPNGEETGFSAFSRLSAVHSLSAAGDAMVAVALAGSVFFDVSASAAQNRVALSLALTVLPFALVGPLVGPLVERARGGRTAIVLVSAVGRAVCCFFMAYWAHSLALFPAAFFSLVFSKLYLVCKAALVPTSVEGTERLVLANSKLSIGGSAAGTLAGVVGVGIMDVFHASGLLRFDIVVYAACAWAATRLRPARGKAAPAGGPARDPVPAPAGGLDDAPPRLDLPPGGLELAAVAIAGLRAVTGFVTFLLVFTFRRDSAALVWYGLALGASQVGNVLGALLAPSLRERFREEWIVTAASAVVGTATLLAGVVTWGRHWSIAVLLAAGTGLAAGSAKLAFDSMVQRDVPVRQRSRSFARFETGFQLSWALGSLVAVLIHMTISQGFIGTGVVGLAGALAFARGSVKARRGTLPAWWPGSAPRPTARS